MSVATPENAASDDGTEKSSDSSNLASATPETALSEAAQAFVDAVAALDREGILTAINAWGLASQAWQADQSNAELTAALEPPRKPRMRRRLPSMPRKISIWLFPMRSVKSKLLRQPTVP